MATTTPSVDIKDAKIAALVKECLSPGAIMDVCDVGDKLGQGGFAVVRSGTMKNDGAKVAIKVILPKAYMTLPQRQAALHEVLVLKNVSRIHHPNVLKFFAAYEDISPTTGIPRLTIITELCNGGELFDTIVAAGHFSEQRASNYICKLSLALQSVHKAGVIHRDLKPENILLRSKDADADPVLADFGLARMSGEVESALGVVGTYSYVSPEIITRKLYSEASDVWALGVLTYILICGYPPFYSEDERDTRPLFTSICRGAYEFHDDAWSDVSAEAKDFVRQMLNVNPAKRATIAQLLTHPWIVNHQQLSNAHRAVVISNMRAFNGRRRLRAAAKAVMWGAGHLHAVRDLIGILGGKSIPADELEKISTAFHKIANNRKSVNFQEFTAVMTELGHHALPIDRIFGVFDVDESGDVDYREFIGGMAALRKDDEAALKMCFSVFDADQDGSVSREELIQLLVSTGFDPSGPNNQHAASGGAGASASNVHAKGAGGGGGSSGAEAKLSDEDEALVEAAVAESETIAKMLGRNGSGISLEPDYLARLSGVFSKIDANHDGKLTFDEFLAAVKADKELAAAIWHPLRDLHTK